MDKGLIGGSTVLMILSLLEEKDYYGYEIIKEIEKRSKSVFQFKEGTLYPVLHRMEDAGLLKAYQGKSETGKNRKYYKMTKQGKTQLSEEKATWETFTGSVSRVLGGVGHAGA